MTATREPLLKATLRYGYFVFQIRATRGAEGMELTGVLENLGTGVKQHFEGGDALVRLLEDWGRKSGFGQ